MLGLMGPDDGISKFFFGVLFSFISISEDFYALLLGVSYLFYSFLILIFLSGDALPYLYLFSANRFFGCIVPIPAGASVPETPPDEL